VTGLRVCTDYISSPSPPPTQVREARETLERFDELSRAQAAKIRRLEVELASALSRHDGWVASTHDYRRELATAQAACSQVRSRVTFAYKHR